MEMQHTRFCTLSGRVIPKFSKVLSSTPLFRCEMWDVELVNPVKLFQRLVCINASRTNIFFLIISFILVSVSLKSFNSVYLLFHVVFIS